MIITHSRLRYYQSFERICVVIIIIITITTILSYHRLFEAYHHSGSSFMSLYKRYVCTLFAVFTWHLNVRAKRGVFWGFATIWGPKTLSVKLGPSICTSINFSFTQKPQTRARRDLIFFFSVATSVMVFNNVGGINLKRGAHRWCLD